MIYLTIGLFALAALFGIVILKNWLGSGDTPKAVIYSHGIFAAVALVLLASSVIKDPGSALRISLLLFIVAAIGGFYMFFRDLKGKFSPVWLAVTHGLLAIAGLVTLIWTII